MTSGQRLQAAEFVLPEKKNVFVSGNPVPVVKANVVGVDLTSNRDAAIVRVSLTVLGRDLSAGQANWTISDPWIWRRGNWYVDVQDARDIIPEPGATPKEDVKKIQEAITQNFEILRDPLDLGKLIEGQHLSVDVPIKYTGDLPIAVEPALPNPVVGMPVGPLVTKDTKNIVLYIGTDDWEGPFNFSFPLKLRYREIEVERTLTVRGEVFVPIAFRQDPPNGSLPEGAEFSVFIRNNTDEDARIRLFSVDAKLDVTKQPRVLPARQETQFTFKRRPGVVPDALFMQLEAPLHGRDSYTYRFRSGQP
jgi:hypothetical protein